MGTIFIASGIYSWLFVIWSYLGLGLILSSALNFYLLLPLVWVFSKAGRVMRVAGFGDGLSWFIVLAISQVGIFAGLFVGLWTADAL